jgi:hypothetical protein
LLLVDKRLTLTDGKSPYQLTASWFLVLLLSLVVQRYLIFLRIECEKGSYLFLQLYRAFLLILTAKFNSEGRLGFNLANFQKRLAPIYAFYVPYTWWFFFPQSGALAAGTSLPVSHKRDQA